MRRASTLLLAAALVACTESSTGPGTTPDVVAPTAVAGADQDVGLGATVTLDGAASSDAVSVALTYAWTQTTGPAVGPLTGARPMFTAPAAVTTLGFQLVVTDAAGNASAADAVSVFVVENPTATV